MRCQLGLKNDVVGNHKGEEKKVVGTTAAEELMAEALESMVAGGRSKNYEQHQ